MQLTYSIVAARVTQYSNECLFLLGVVISKYYTWLMD